jgi:hypothetical protein
MRRRVTGGDEQAKLAPCPILSPFFWRKGGKPRTSTCFVHAERRETAEAAHYFTTSTPRQKATQPLILRATGLGSG